MAISIERLGFTTDWDHCASALVQVTSFNVSDLNHAGAIMVTSKMFREVMSDLARPISKNWALIFSAETTSCLKESGIHPR